MKELLFSFGRLVRRNIWMKLFALALAFIVWLVVVAYYNPETTDTIYGVPITVDANNTMLTEQGLILVSDIENTLDVRIEGRRAQLAVIGRDRVTAAVDLSSVTKAGEYSLPINVSIDGQTVRTVSQSLQTVTLRFENSVVGQFTVEAVANGRVPSGYVLEKTLNPAVVKLTGPESVVSSIVTVQAVVEQTEFTESGVYESKMVYLDRSGRELDATYLTLDTDSVNMNISVLEEKIVPLQMEIVNNSGGSDATFLTPEIEPKTIRITGSSDSLANINSISLGTLDVSTLTENYKEEVELILPNGIRNLDNITTAQVSLRLDNLVTRQFTLGAAQLVLENAGVDAAVSDTTATVTVRGLGDDVNRMQAAELLLAVDCTNLTLSKGSNRLTAYVRFPDGYRAGAVGKYELNVTVP